MFFFSLRSSWALSLSTRAVTLLCLLCSTAFADSNRPHLLLCSFVNMLTNLLLLTGLEHAICWKSWLNICLNSSIPCVRFKSYTAAIFGNFGLIFSGDSEGKLRLYWLYKYKGSSLCLWCDCRYIWFHTLCSLYSLRGEVRLIWLM